MLNLNTIVKCLKELGYEKLTELQRRSLYEVYSGNSTIIIAPTGSGKTEAAVFPVMLSIASKNLKPIAALYITPLRALNRDIARRLENIARCFGLEVAIRHGDTPQRARKLIEQSPPHILVTTPETFNYIVLNDELRKHLENLEFIVLDEFRELIESKRGLLLLTNIYLLEKYLGKRFVKVALTATLSSDVEELAKRLVEPEGANVVILRDKSIREMDIKVIVPECTTEFCKSLSEDLGDSRVAARVETICDIISKYKHVLVFTNTRSLAEKLGALLNNVSQKYGLRLSFEVHHGSLSRQHRESVEYGFKSGSINSLIATSSLELGIDIGHVNYVVQYMSPRQATRLIQRVGRSRHRIGEKGQGVIISINNLLHELECGVIALEAREGFNEKEIIPRTPLDVLAYAVALYTAINPSGVSIDELYQVLVKHPLYSNLTREELALVLDYLSYTRVLRVQEGSLQPTRRIRLYLYRISMIPSSREVRVISIDKAEVVGTLDEEYVVTCLEPGDLIVLAGKLWKVISYDSEEGKLYVEPGRVDVEEVVVPHWEGENIPVDYTIATRVGEVVRYIKTTGQLPGDLRDVMGEFAIPESIRDLGDDTTIYVDYIQKPSMVIVNAYGGTRLNNFLKDLLKFVIRTMYPQIRIRAHATPYAVILLFKRPITADQARSCTYNVLKELYKYASEEIVERVAMESTALLWRIYQVAQRFGAISPEAQVNRKLLEAFKETIVGREAVKEVMLRDYDIESFLKLAENVREGVVNVQFRVYDRIYAHHSIIQEYAELPRVLDMVVFDVASYYERLLRRRITLLCINCGYFREGRVEEFLTLQDYHCPKCGYATLSVVKGNVTEELELVKKLKRGEKLKPEERKLHEDLAKRAVLLYRYREKALLTLAGRGVSTQEAIRIINKTLEGADLVTEIAESEKRFLMIKNYIKEREEDEE